jgi:predicted O-methyltransferase YrrM
VKVVTLKYRLQAAAAKLGVNIIRKSGFFNGYWNYWRSDFFDYAEKQGIHLLPVHYYSPIPTIQDRVRRRRKTELIGIDFNIQSGVDRANYVLKMYIDDIIALLTAGGPTDYKRANPALHPLDAALLYASVREARPRQIIEIGSGMSTLVISAALRDANLSNTRFTCIEPFLPSYLRPTPPYISEILEVPLQDVGLDTFERLEANDILFIDSTHVVRYGSDVVYEILEILPSLRPGVLIHIHDIFLPDDYPERWLAQDRYFWSEQYMLQAFLCMNPHFKIEIPVHAVKNEISQSFGATVLAPDLSVIPTSLWLRRI